MGVQVFGEQILLTLLVRIGSVSGEADLWIDEARITKGSVETLEPMMVTRWGHRDSMVERVCHWLERDEESGGGVK